MSIEQQIYNISSFITFVGVAIAFIYLIGAKKSFTPPITKIINKMILAMIMAMATVIGVWIDEILFRGGMSSRQLLPLDISFTVIGLLAIVLFIRQIVNFTHQAIYKKIKGGVRALAWGFGIVVASFILSMLNVYIWDIMWLTLSATTICVVGFFIIAYGAYRVRTIQVGGILQLILLIGFFLYLGLSSLLIITNNAYIQEKLVENYGKLTSDFVKVDTQDHLTLQSFDINSAERDQQWQSFANRLNFSGEIKRLRVILPDGYVLYSDQSDLIGTKVSVKEEYRQVLRGTPASLFIPKAQALKTEINGEKYSDDVLILVIPIGLNDGKGERAIAELVTSATPLENSIFIIQSSMWQIGIYQMLVVFLLVLILFIVLNREVIRPLTDLYYQIIHIRGETEDGEGHFHRVNVKTSDTFDELAQAVNELIEEFETRERALKDKLEKKKWSE